MMRGFFKKTPFEFNDAESAGTVPYMAPEVLRQCPYGRSVDWWSAGIVMYKLMTGRVPFRGKNRQVVRDRIITAPLRFPRADERDHSATTPAKDMVFRMLRKNSVDRLGSRTYDELKTHPFFDRFNWKRLHHDGHLCDIPSVGSPGNVSKKSTESATISAKHRKLKLVDMRDLSADGQRPLLCFSSSSFKKLIVAVEKARETISVSSSFMDTTDEPSSDIPYTVPVKLNDVPQLVTPTAEDPRGAISPASLLVGADNVDVVLYRKKRYNKFWDFGFALCSLKGEDNIHYVMVNYVRPDSPADKSHLLVLDFVLKVNGERVLNVALGRVKTLVAASGDHLLLTVMSSSPYRVLTTRRDMMSVLRSAPLVNVTLQEVGGICSLQKTYGIELLEPDVWDDREKQFAKVYVVKTEEANIVSRSLHDMKPHRNVGRLRARLAALLNSVAADRYAITYVDSTLYSSSDWFVATVANYRGINLPNVASGQVLCPALAQQVTVALILQNKYRLHIEADSQAMVSAFVCGYVSKEVAFLLCGRGVSTHVIIWFADPIWPMVSSVVPNANEMVRARDVIQHAGQVVLKSVDAQLHKDSLQTFN
ncbi:hypothetical protein MRX96_058809 [Rhipicephalus microplus]